MSEFFNLLFESSSCGTIVLYTVIFIMASAFMFSAQKKVIGQDIYIFSLPKFIGALLILGIFFAFNDVGIDTPHYRSYFNQYTNLNNTYEGYGAVELWFQYLMIGLHYVTDDSEIAIAIIRTLQITIIFWALFLLRHKIILGYAIMAYVALYYLQSFDLLRSSLAGSLCLLCFAFIYNRKYIPAVIAVALAVGFHRSAILFVAAMIIYLLSTLVKKHTTLIQTCGIIATVGVLYLGADLLKMTLDSDFGSGRYENYTDMSGTGFGVFIIFQYLPIAYALYILKKQIAKQDDLRWWNLCFIFAISGFSIAILGYTNGMLTRAAIFFSMSFIFLLPSLIRKDDDGSIKSNKGLIHTCLIIFYTFLFMNTTGGIYEMDGIGPFKFI